MRILATQYTLATKSLDIYVAGCKGDRNGRHCPGCHNPESWDFDQGRPYDLVSATEIWPHFIEFGQLIQNAMIFGGEPLDQDESDLIKMLIDISGFGVQIWLFTRHELNEVPASVKEFCATIRRCSLTTTFSAASNSHRPISASTLKASTISNYLHHGGTHEIPLD